MFKKFSLSIVLSLLASLLCASLAFAQAGPSSEHVRGGRRGVGQLLSVGEDRFSLKTRQGSEQTFYVDDNTQFRDAQGNSLGFADLQTGQWVAAVAQPNPEGLLVARMVIVLPDDYDPSQRLGRRASGNITAVDAGANTFQLQTRRGEDLTFSVNDNTLYRGGAASLDDLQAGMLASVGSLEQDDGSLLALVVLARYPLVQHAGTVIAVQAAGGTFELETRAGETLSIAVDEQTRYRSRDGAVQSLEDVQPGMVALVVAKTTWEGQLTAVAVAAGTQDQLPQFDLRSLGRVVSLNESGFILQAPNGEQYSILVTGDTRFRSWRSQMRGLADLAPGMRILVGAEMLEDGVYEARLIVAGKRLRP